MGARRWQGDFALPLQGEQQDTTGALLEQAVGLPLVPMLAKDPGDGGSVPVRMRLQRSSDEIEIGLADMAAAYGV